MDPGVYKNVLHVEISTVLVRETEGPEGMALTSTKVWLAQPNSSDPSGATDSFADGQPSCPDFILQAWVLTHQVAFTDLGTGLGQPLMCAPRHQVSQCVWPSHATYNPPNAESLHPSHWMDLDNTVLCLLKVNIKTHSFSRKLSKFPLLIATA